MDHSNGMQSNNRVNRCDVSGVRANDDMEALNHPLSWVAQTQRKRTTNMIMYPEGLHCEVQVSRRLKKWREQYWLSALMK